jgi:chorismate dehydratase
MSYRIGVVSYLNAKPLTWAIEQGWCQPLAMVLDVPSRLAGQLRAGELDAAMLSAVVSLREPDFQVLPAGGCIAADGPVQSVLLFSKVNLGQIRSVALDTSSLTGQALTKVLLGQRYGLAPEYHALPPNLEAMLAEHDAALLIGDPGLAHYFRDDSRLQAYDVLDLGRAWRDWTGLPFVFATWQSRHQAPGGELDQLLGEARRRSTAEIPQIAAWAARDLGLPEGVCRFYLEHVIRYELGSRERDGLALFGQYLARLEAA